MVYVGAAFIILIFFIQSATNTYDKRVTVTLLDAETKEAIKIKRIRMIPDLPLKNDEVLAGKGSHIYHMGDMTGGIIITEADGYDKTYSFKLIKPYNEIIIYMHKTESKTDQSEKKEEGSKEDGKATIQSTDERKDLDFDLIKLD